MVGFRKGSLQARLSDNPPFVAAALATVLLVALAAGLAFGWVRLAALEALELITVDARFRTAGARTPSPEFVIVGVDDRTRAEFPETFQTRRGWATLLSAIDEQSPSLIALDVFFSSPEIILSAGSMAALKEAQALLSATPERSEREDKVARALTVIENETRGDEILARAIKHSGRVALGVMFFFSTAPPTQVRAELPPGVALARYADAAVAAAPTRVRPPVASGAIGALPAIAEGATIAGSVNLLRDVDGSVRRVYGVIEYAGNYYMPLGMVAALRLRGEKASYVVQDEFVTVGARRMTSSPRGEFTLSFLGGSHAFPHVSAADILSGAVPPDALRDKIVFVGVTDAARDKIATPLSPAVDGVELHATLAHNLVHDELLQRTRPWFAVLATLLVCVLLTLAQSRRLRRRRAWVGGLVAVAVAVVYLAFAQLAFQRSLLIPVVVPLLAAGVVAFVAMVIALVTEGREKSALRSAFSQYVNESLVASIVADPSKARLGGERRDLTVLFSDIRGFSRLSESLEPEQLSSFLNEYLTPMTDIVLTDGGMLDKYIGDAVMAVYGAPLELAEHANRACHTALAMLESLEALNSEWRVRGLPEIAIGIGLNSGAMAVGNMGSELRFDYTVLGDSVNLGARLESLTKEYDVPILCGEATALTATAHLFRELDFVRVTGRDAVARVFQLLGARAGTSWDETSLDLYREALAAYRAHEWERADLAFSRFEELHPNDGPAAVMRRRIAKLKSVPPEPSWDGVFSQRSK